MPSTKPLQWIEQAEAREMMIDAVFKQKTASSRRRRARQAIGDILANAWSYLVPEPPTAQLRPVLAPRRDRQLRVLRREDPYR